MLWICYKIVCGKSESGEDILLDKKIGYSAENLVIAEAEAYNGKYTTEEDSDSFDKEPLGIEFGGTNAKTAKEACKNIGAVLAPENTDLVTEGYLYQETDGTTRLVDSHEKDNKFKYSIVIDNGDDMNPGAIEYADDCVGFLPGKFQSLGDWENTALIKEYFRPCVIAPNDNVPKYYLNHNNMTLKEDGASAVITGADGDVMIEVKKLYIKFLVSGTKTKISLANYKVDDDYICCNNVGGVEKDVVYRGAFKAGVASGANTVMRSIANVEPLTNITRGEGRMYARNRGAAYCQNDIYLLFLWQIMYLFVYKNRNSQKYLGNGYSSTSNTGAKNTGWSASKPFCWGNDGGKDGVKFLGVEDFYGNIWEWVDGIVYKNNTYKLTHDHSLYNDTGDGYEISTESGIKNTDNDNKYIVSMMHTKHAQFLPSASSSDGSATSFWCDKVWVKDGTQTVSFGGSWLTSDGAGAFCWGFDTSTSYSALAYGSRLCRE